MIRIIYVTEKRQSRAIPIWFSIVIIFTFLTNNIIIIIKIIVNLFSMPIWYYIIYFCGLHKDKIEINPIFNKLNNKTNATFCEIKKRSTYLFFFTLSYSFYFVSRHTLVTSYIAYGTYSVRYEYTKVYKWYDHNITVKMLAL